MTSKMKAIFKPDDYVEPADNTTTKVVKVRNAKGKIKEYVYEYEAKTGKPGRKAHPNKKKLREMKITEEEAAKLLLALEEMRQ